MTRPNKPISQRLFEASIAISNTLSNPAILAAVTPRGYTQAKLETALALCEEVRALTDAQQKEYGEQHEATATVQKAWAEAQLPYSDALKTARIAFRGNQSAHTSLMLGGIRKKTLNGWFDQASRFYNNLLGSAEFKAAMLPYGYTQAKLEAESALVAAVKTAIDAQYKERGEAQQATKMRDAKLDELDQWLADYKKIAAIALAGSPQQLEQLGWIVPS